MKKKISLLSLAVFSLLSVTFAQSGAQDYQTAIGMKFYPGAISLKHFVSPQSALEGLASFWNQGSRFQALYEVHGDLNITDGLKWYFGGGAHVSFFKSAYGGVSPGIDGILGLDYKFNNAPINISLDWNPSFELGDYSGSNFLGDWGGLAIRYVF